MTTAFSEVQYEALYPDGIERHWWTMARTQIILQVIHRFRLQSSKILEVGCGRGVVVKSLVDHQLDCYGVELAAIPPLNSIQDRVASGVSAECLPGSLRDDIECILLLDVIEHIEAPDEFIAGLLAAFPKLQHIIVTVPAGQAIWSNYDEFNGHYRRYSLAMLRDTAAEINARVMLCGYFFHLVYWPAWVLKKLSVNRSTRIKAPGQLASVVHKIVAFLFKTEALILPSHWIGSSAIACFNVKEHQRRG